MSENRSYRINTNINKDNVVNVQISQDIDCLEILSLKINQVDTYRLQSANYGVIVGRVLANDGFGVPNVKVSVFIELDKVDKENPDITTIYPYTSMQTRDKDGRKYNLLPDNDNGNGDCYRIVGTFPNKRLVLDNENQLEVFDKYWKYTTVTNNAGDYMIFGVPVGVHTVHIDCDLSDIGILSQKPRDFYYKGYEKTNFENASQFKASTTLEDLVQIISQDKSIQVYPFWGDRDNSDVIALSRCDLNLAYKFEPTCVFMGSVITDDYSNAIGHNCSPSSRIGYNDTLTTNSGTIEMIRKTPDGAVEEYQIQGNELIDGDGVWCYQIPMNLDYIKTDEYGNIVPTDNPNEGIPTRTCARFRISTSETFNEGTGRHRAKYLVPNNMEMSFNGGHKLKNAKEFENCYEFGSKTQDSDFRSMYWNKIYSVKNYIPRIQTNNKSRITNYTGIRSVNIGSTNNPHPFNKMRITLKFGYVVTCILMTVIFMIVGFLNVLISLLLEICVLPDFMNPCLFGACLPQYCIFKEWPFNLKCISFNFPNVGPSGEDETYAPMCWEHEEGVRTSWNSLVDRMQQALAMEYDLVNLDFHNDWINGTLYMPLWFWKKTKKKKYLWGLFSKKAVNTYCACDKVKSKTRVYDSCALPLTSELIPRNGQQSSAEKASSHYTFGRGVIQEITVSTNKDDLKVYYYATGLAKTDNTYTHLFATDLILLGSFNKCDWDNMPNVVSYLPPTTANIPFMTTVREVDENSADTPFNDITPGGGNPNGDVAGPGNGNINGGENSNVTSIESTAEITGMDWTHNGKDNAYVPGLFLDIACTGTTTLTKTCYNLKRLCELGVDLDSGYVIAIPEGNKGEMKEIQVDADGLVLYQDIGDHESRAMFATLNHNSLKSSVRNNITTYNNHLLYYMYPQNFDGGMTYAAKNVKSTLKDMQDSDYRKFRYGTYEEPQLGNINRYSESFPIYNNSFYFYFGLKQGKTAIEKFRNLYDAACRTNKKYGFSIGVETKNSSVCSEGDGSITITLENARTPCSVTLYNRFKEEMCFSGDTNVLNEVECTDKENGTPTEGLRDMSSLPYSNFTLSGLTNDSYTLEIVDASNKTIVENVVLTQELSTVYTLGSSLVGKYDPMNESNADSLTKAECGILTLYDFMIEGEEVDGINLPSSISIDNDNSFIIEAQDKKVKCTISYISDSEFEIDSNDFLHKDSKTVDLEEISITTGEKTMGYRLYVKKNGTYVITIQQMCDDDLKGAKTTVRQVIGNGTKFTLYVNDVDVNYVQPILPSANSECQIHLASSYKLPLSSYTDSNIETWLDYVDGIVETGLIQGTPNPLKVDEKRRISDENKLNILDCISYQEKLINAINESDYVVANNEDFNITNEIIRLLNEGGGEDMLYYSGSTDAEFDAFVNKLYENLGETPTTKPTKDDKDASGNPIYSGDTDTNLIKDVQKYYSVLPKYYCEILNRINIFQMVEKINDIYNEYNLNIDDYNEKVDKILENVNNNQIKETLLFDLFSILNNIIGLYEKLQANSSEYELFDKETEKILKIKLTDSSFGVSTNINLMNDVLYGDIDKTYKNISNYINNILNIYVQTLLNPPQEILENNALIILNNQINSLCKLSKATYVTSEGGNTFNIHVKGGREPVIICSEYPMYEEAIVPQNYEDTYELPKVAHSVSTTEISTSSKFATNVSQNYCTFYNPCEISYWRSKNRNKLLMPSIPTYDDYAANYIASIDNNGLHTSSDGYVAKILPNGANISDFELKEMDHNNITQAHVKDFFRCNFKDRALDYNIYIQPALSESLCIEGILDNGEFNEDGDYIKYDSTAFQRPDYMDLQNHIESGVTYEDVVNLQGLLGNVKLKIEEYASNNTIGQFEAQVSSISKNYEDWKSSIKNPPYTNALPWYQMYVFVYKWIKILKQRYGVTVYDTNKNFEESIEQINSSYQGAAKSLAHYEYVLWATQWTRGSMIGNIFNGIDMGYTYFNMDDIKYGNVEKLLDFVGDTKLISECYNGIKYFDNTNKDTIIISYNDERFDILSYTNYIVDSNLSRAKEYAKDYINKIKIFITDQTQTWYVQVEGREDTKNYPTKEVIKECLSKLTESLDVINSCTAIKDVDFCAKYADEKSLDIRRKTKLVYQSYYDSFVGILSDYAEEYNYNIVSPETSNDNTDLLYEIKYSNSNNGIDGGDKSIADTVTMKLLDKNKVGENQSKQRFYCVKYDVNGKQYDIKDCLGTNTNTTSTFDTYDNVQLYRLSDGTVSRLNNWQRMYADILTEKNNTFSENTHEMFTLSDYYYTKSSVNDIIEKDELNWKYSGDINTLFYKPTQHSFGASESNEVIPITIKSLYIGNIPQTEKIELTFEGCSYDIESEVKDMNGNKVLSAKTKKGEVVSIKPKIKMQDEIEILSDVKLIYNNPNFSWTSELSPTTTANSHILLNGCFTECSGGTIIIKDVAEVDFDFELQNSSGSYTLQPQCFQNINDNASNRVLYTGGSDLRINAIQNSSITEEELGYDKYVLYSSGATMGKKYEDDSRLKDVTFNFHMKNDATYWIQDLIGVGIKRIYHDKGDETHLKTYSLCEIPYVVDTRSPFTKIEFVNTPILEYANDRGGIQWSGQVLSSISIELNEYICNIDEIVDNFSISVQGLDRGTDFSDYISDYTINNQTITYNINYTKLINRYRNNANPSIYLNTLRYPEILISIPNDWPYVERLLSISFKYNGKFYFYKHIDTSTNDGARP